MVNFVKLTFLAAISTDNPTIDPQLYITARQRAVSLTAPFRQSSGLQYRLKHKYEYLLLPCIVAIYSLCSLLSMFHINAQHKHKLIIKIFRYINAFLANVADLTS